MNNPPGSSGQHQARILSLGPKNTNKSSANMDGDDEIKGISFFVDAVLIPNQITTVDVPIPKMRKMRVEPTPTPPPQPESISLNSHMDPPAELKQIKNGGGDKMAIHEMSHGDKMSSDVGMISFKSSLGRIPTVASQKPIGEITLANLLQGSPDIGKGRQNPSASSRSEGRLASDSGFLSETSRLVNKYSSSRTASSLFSQLESSKLAMLDSPNYVEGKDIQGKRKLKRARQVEREKTKGTKWFNMSAPELTQERKNDLEALRLRGALDTKRFYKRNNLTHQPKYFQVGKIVEGPADYYNSRVPKRQRKKTLADEMVAEVSSTVSHL